MTFTHTDRTTPLPFSQACENNQAPILEVLRHALAHSCHVLEIGSGTGQHSVYFAPHLPHLIWQTSDLAENHDGIRAWHAAYRFPNLRGPLNLDLATSPWPVNASAPAIDAVFTSNTCHIVSWPLVQRLLQQVGSLLPEGGVLVIYGPFNYGGCFTSESNRAFDAWLRQRDPDSGIRDFEALTAVAEQQHLHLLLDQPMPANNRTLVFRKQQG